MTHPAKNQCYHCEIKAPLWSYTVNRVSVALCKDCLAKEKAKENDGRGKA